jgi:hypothetical protein
VICGSHELGRQNGSKWTAMGNLNGGRSASLAAPWIEHLFGPGSISANLGRLSILLSGSAGDTDGSNDLPVGDTPHLCYRWLA